MYMYMYMHVRTTTLLIIHSDPHFKMYMYMYVYYTYYTYIYNVHSGFTGRPVVSVQGKKSGPCESRTHDLGVISTMLYRLS